MDYRYLLSRSYSEKTTIKLVGDKYRLTGVERSILYRGISSKKDSEYRFSKKTDLLTQGNIYIDAYNVLFTLANYLNGRPLFICDDGFLRDAGEMRGRLDNLEIVNKIKELLYGFFASRSQLTFLLYLDRPVSNSGKLAAEINQYLSINKINGQAQTCDSPDIMIISQSGNNDIVCSSDSLIIDKSESRIYDLSFHILKEKYDTNFIDLSTISNTI